MRDRSPNAQDRADVGPCPHYPAGRHLGRASGEWGVAEETNATASPRWVEPERVGSSTTLPAGARVGKYEIAAVLGQGSFGITYRARDTQLDRDVAIKEYMPTSFAVREPDAMVLPRSTQVAEDFRWGRTRFLDEAKTLARLT